MLLYKVNVNNLDILYYIYIWLLIETVFIFELIK